MRESQFEEPLSANEELIRQLVDAFDSVIRQDPTLDTAWCALRLLRTGEPHVDCQVAALAGVAFVLRAGGWGELAVGVRARSRLSSVN